MKADTMADRRKGNAHLSSAPPDNSPPPPGGYRNLCGMCHQPIEADGQCAACGGWPHCVWLASPHTGEPIREHGRKVFHYPTPSRACWKCGDRLDVWGCCRTCTAQMAPDLIHPSESPVRGMWVPSDDQGPFPRPRLSLSEAQAEIAGILAMLGRSPMPGPGRSPVTVEQARARFLRQHAAEEEAPF